MKPFQNIPFTLHFSALAVLIAAIALFAQPVQADPVLRGYWTFDSDTVESGVITESSGYLPGVHNGTLINNTSVVDEQTVNGVKSTFTFVSVRICKEVFDQVKSKSLLQKPMSLMPCAI